MALMNAAVVTSFAEPPRYQPFQVPVPAEEELLVDVLAAGLHPGSAPAPGALTTRAAAPCR
jgi:hypothetical protein